MKDIKLKTIDGATFRITQSTITPAKPKLRLIYLHGWGRSHQDFLPFFKNFEKQAEQYAIDLPGFAGLDSPAEIWGAEDYAKALAIWLKERPFMPTFFIGHSFGGRIAIELAAHFPKLANAIILIAASGIKRKKSLTYYLKIYLYKMLAWLTDLIDKAFRTKLTDRLRAYFGSADYKNASPIMRAILTKAVNTESLTAASKITCPALLLYGEKDQDTPPSFGRSFKKTIPNAKLVELPHFDHHSILTAGRHQLTVQISSFIKNLLGKDLQK